MYINALTKAACCRNIEIVLHPTILSYIYIYIYIYIYTYCRNQGTNCNTKWAVYVMYVVCNMLTPQG